MRQGLGIEARLDSIEARLAALESRQAHPRTELRRLLDFNDAVALKKAEVALTKPPQEQPARSFEELQAGYKSLSEAQAAAQLAVTDRTIRNHVRSGTLTRMDGRIAVDAKFQKLFSAKRRPAS
jgi:hypothetical protein